MRIFTYKLRYLLTIICVVSIGISSCNKLIAIDQPINAITLDKVFKDSASAALALSGMFIQMDRNSSFATNLVNLSAAMSADEITYNGTSTSYTEFMNNDLDAGNSSIAQLWNYSVIYQANAIIEKVNETNSLSSSFTAQMIGTAKFIRSFYYFYLVNMFGDVPLITSTDYTHNATVSRTSTDSIYTQIIEDLKDAIIKLPVDYDGRLNKAGITKWAASALLARVYLYQQDWQNAFDLCNEIIKSNVFQFPDNLNKVFLANSGDAIWQLAPLDGQGFTSEGNIFIPNTGLIPNYELRNALLNSFEPGDKRATKWIGTVNVNNVNYYFPFKYKVSSGVDIPTEYYMMFRLAEEYLIRAEAEAQLGRSADALADIDKIRNRAGLLPYTGNGISYSKEELLQLILNERQHELFCEWGHRWFDLKRTGKVDEILGAVKDGWKPSDALYPIPEGEIRVNPYLKPNP